MDIKTQRKLLSTPHKDSGDYDQCNQIVSSLKYWDLSRKSSSSDWVPPSSTWQEIQVVKRWTHLKYHKNSKSSLSGHRVWWVEESLVINCQVHFEHEMSDKWKKEKSRSSVPVTIFTASASSIMNFEAIIKMKESYSHTLRWATSIQWVLWMTSSVSSSSIRSPDLYIQVRLGGRSP